MGGTSSSHGLEHREGETHPVSNCKPAQQTAVSAALQSPTMVSTVEEGDVFGAQPVWVVIGHDDASGSLMATRKRLLRCSRLEKFRKKLKQFSSCDT